MIASLVALTISTGGVIAFGHPLGCTGAKLTATALYELRRRGGRDAMVTMGICGC